MIIIDNLKEYILCYGVMLDVINENFFVFYLGDRILFWLKLRFIWIMNSVGFIV